MASSSSRRRRRHYRQTIRHLPIGSCKAIASVTRTPRSVTNDGKAGTTSSVRPSAVPWPLLFDYNEHHRDVRGLIAHIGLPCLNACKKATLDVRREDRAYSSLSAVRPSSFEPDNSSVLHRLIRLHPWLTTCALPASGKVLSPVPKTTANLPEDCRPTVARSPIVRPTVYPPRSSSSRGGHAIAIDQLLGLLNANRFATHARLGRQYSHAQLVKPPLTDRPSPHHSSDTTFLRHQKFHFRCQIVADASSDAFKNQNIGPAHRHFAERLCASVSSPHPTITAAWISSLI